MSCSTTRASAKPACSWRRPRRTSTASSGINCDGRADRHAGSGETDDRPERPRQRSSTPHRSPERSANRSRRSTAPARRAVISLSQAGAEALGKHNITVNCFSPGFVKTADVGRTGQGSDQGRLPRGAERGRGACEEQGDPAPGLDAGRSGRRDHFPCLGQIGLHHRPESDGRRAASGWSKRRAAAPPVRRNDGRQKCTWLRRSRPG